MEIALIMSTGIYLILGVFLGIVGGFILIDYLTEEIKWRKFKRDYKLRNPNDDIL